MAEDESNPTEFVAPTLEELEPLFPAYELEWGPFIRRAKNL